MLLRSLSSCNASPAACCGWRPCWLPVALGRRPGTAVAAARAVTAADGRLPHAACCTTVPPGHRPCASHVLPLYRPCTARQVPVRAHRRPGPAGRRLHLRHRLCAGSRHLGAPAAAASNVCSGSRPTCFLRVNKSLYSSFLFLPEGLLHLGAIGTEMDLLCCRGWEAGPAGGVVGLGLLLAA